MSEAVRARDLNVAFGTAHILKNVNYTAATNGINVIVGRSGSGKSTLLRQFNLLNETFPGYAASGSVQMNFGDGLQEIMTNMGMQVCQLRRRAAMVFQTPDVLPVSIRRNLLLPLKVVADVKGEAAEARMQFAMAQAGLWDEVKDRLDAPAESLSGGQKQRLCIARAITLEPAILLLDEPTASLDVLAAAIIEELLMALSKRLPIVMVTHTPGQAARLAKNLAVMADGRVARQIESVHFSDQEIQDLL